MNNPYELELQKTDLMIGIWQEITRFSDRVLTLQRNHRSSIHNLMHRQTSVTHPSTNNTNNSIPITHSTTPNGTQIHKPNGNNNTNNNNTNKNKKHRQKRHYRFSTGNDTSSSESESDDDIAGNNSSSDHSSSNNSANNVSDGSDIYSDSDDEYKPNGNKQSATNQSSANNSNPNVKNKGKNDTKSKRKTTKGRCSGYNVYFGVRCKEIQKLDPNLEFATISRNIGNEWKNLVKSEQAKWNEIAAKTTKQRKEAAERKERKQKKQLKQEKKRKLSELNNNPMRNGIGTGNAIVSNICIQDVGNKSNEFKLTPKTMDALNALKSTMDALNSNSNNGSGCGNGNVTAQVQVQGPPQKKMKFNIGNGTARGQSDGINITNMNLLDSINTLNGSNGIGLNGLNGLNGNLNGTNELNIFNQTSPALSLLSEALKKMPEIHSMQGKGNVKQ